MQTMTRSSNSVLPAKTIESKVEIMEDTSLSDKEVLSSVDQLSVKGLAHRFSTTLVSSSQPDCLAPTTTFNGNKDFQQVRFLLSTHHKFYFKRLGLIRKNYCSQL